MKVIVLGSGVVGTTTAWYLARAGHEVEVIDRQPAPALETSFANAGEVSPGYSSPWAAPGIPWKAVKWMFAPHAPLVIRPKLDAENAPARFRLTPGNYGIVTLHRPSNVDEAPQLKALVEALVEASQRLPLMFPMHPRTKSRVEAFGLSDTLAKGNITIAEPQSYKPFMSLLKDARIAITDSGGLQEETTYLGIPCLTLRDNTERPITVTEGTNRLVKADALVGALDAALAAPPGSAKRPEFWDGRTAERCVADLVRRGR